MTIALLAALVAVNLAYVWHLERKDRRHDSQVNRLLHWVHSPATASLEQAHVSYDGPRHSNEFREEQARLLQLVGDE